MKAVVKYDGKMHFTGLGESNFPIEMDAKPEVGGEGKGARPVELVLFALGGCTGMDVVSILRKMQVEFRSFKIDVVTEHTKEHPVKITKAKLNFVFEGDNIPEDKVQRAIFLSQSKYCSVGNTLRAGVEMEVTYEINGKKGVVEGL